MGVYRWRLVRECFRHEDVVLSDLYHDRLRPVIGPGMHCLDPPAHTELRSAIEPVFRETLGDLSDRRLRELIGSVVESLPDRGEVDLVSEFTTVFPFRVLGAMIGVPEEDLEWLRVATFRFGLNYMFGGPGSGGTKDLAAPRDELLSFFRDLVRKRRNQSGKDDLIERLLDLSVDGRSLGDEEIIAFLLHLAPAATATTAMASGMLFYALMRHRPQSRHLREDLSRVHDAVEEGLRWSPPFAVVQRQAKASLTLGETEVPAGTRLALFIAAANRDPERFDDPHDFDLRRDSSAHLSFAAGPHVCLGESLARREMRTAIRVFFDRWEEVRIDPERREKAYIGGRYWRGIPQLPVLLSG